MTPDFSTIIADLEEDCGACINEKLLPYLVMINIFRYFVQNKSNMPSFGPKKLTNYYQHVIDKRNDFTFCFGNSSLLQLVDFALPDFEYLHTFAMLACHRHSFDSFEHEYQKLKLLQDSTIEYLRGFNIYEYVVNTNDLVPDEDSGSYLSETNKCTVLCMRQLGGHYDLVQNIIEYKQPCLMVPKKFKDFNKKLRTFFDAYAEFCNKFNIATAIVFFEKARSILYDFNISSCTGFRFSREFMSAVRDTFDFASRDSQIAHKALQLLDLVGKGQISQDVFRTEFNALRIGCPQ